ncbi:MAG: RsiV family protein [Prevotellaceae bacterium]|jgi:hypothetical protein|nr:RsiV family protein [Prevotellaceae bacterium]
MKNLLISALALSSLVVILFSCEKNKSIEFTNVEYKKTIHSPLVTDTNSFCTVEIHFLFPEKFSDKEALTKIQQTLLVYSFDSTSSNYTATQAIDSFAVSTFNNFNDLIATAFKKNENRTNPVINRHSESYIMNTDILLNEKSILSYQLSRYTDSGGAHGLENTQFLVFDLETGNKLTQRDLFEEGYEPRLAELLKQQIMVDKGFESEEQMLFNGYFSLENIKANENFSLENEGITYIFNPYEIASYATGATVVSIPYEKIKPLLKKDSPILRLMK